MTRREFWERRLGSATEFRSADVARVCSVNQRTVQRWAKEGRLLALASSADDRYELRVPRDAVLDFLVRRTPLAEYPFYVEV